MNLIGRLLTFLIVSLIVTGSWLISISNEEYLIKEFLSVHQTKLEVESDKVTTIFEQLYTNMRAMAFTTELRALANKRSLNELDKKQLQKFFDAISEDVALSEIYIAPLYTKFEGLSPTELPKELIALEPEEKRDQRDHEEEEEHLGVETYELKEISSHMKYFADQYPTLNEVNGVRLPATTGMEVIVCDNRGLETAADHTGFVYSMPFYDHRGNFAGVISAMIKTHIFTDLFNDPFYQLKREINPVVLKNESNTTGLSDMEKPFVLIKKLQVVDRFPWHMEMQIPPKTYERNQVIAEIKNQKLAIRGLGLILSVLVLILGILKSNNLIVNRLNNSLKIEIEKRLKSEARLSQFTSDAGHELRSPLAIIKGEVEVALLKERSVGDYQETLNHILNSVNRLHKLVSDLLYIGRSSPGEVTLNLSRTHISSLITSEFEREYQKWGLEKNIELINNISPDFTLNLDADKMKIAVSNILSNSLKHIQTEGKIWAKLVSDEDQVKLIFIDSGPGINNDEVDKIFDRFYRSEKARTIGTSGLGLGLSIVSKIVELHDGSIRAYNAPELGLAIELTFPLKVESDA